jgi:purine-cytosine permease-like protein
LSSTVLPSSVREAPVTLAEPAVPTQGLRDVLGLWLSLGVSLLLPVAASFVVLAGRPLLSTLLAVLVGSVIGALLLGATAAPGARERVPAMVLLRGLLGHRASWLPTGLNVVQCLGWATFEIVVIAEAASRALDAPRWPFVLAAGVLATAMALRPLGVVRVLSRYAVWAALAAVVYLYVRVLAEPLPQVAEGGAGLVLVGRRHRHRAARSAGSRSPPTTRGTSATPAPPSSDAGRLRARDVVMFTLGVLALSAYATGGLDVIDALLAVPVRLLAVLVLVAVEVDEAFANIYSTAVSTQNLSPRARPPGHAPRRRHGRRRCSR